METCFHELHNHSLVLCLHVGNDYLLWFSKAPSGLNIMWYFSFRQTWHDLVDGLKALPLSSIFQLTTDGVGFPLIFSFQMCLIFWLVVSILGVFIDHAMLCPHPHTTVANILLSLPSYYYSVISVLNDGICRNTWEAC